ncbi:MBL fold metallo-hydrolase [Lachnospiraceae bacterium ZAX-1]
MMQKTIIRKSGVYSAISIGDRTIAIEEKLSAFQCIFYLLEGEDVALLIDTGFGLGDVMSFVSLLTDKPITVVNTHAHFDHIGGNPSFDNIYLDEKEQDVLKLFTDEDYLQKMAATMVPALARLLFRPYIKKIVTPKIGGTYHYIADGHQFSLGGRDVEVIETPGHSPGSICLYDEHTKILFSGDTVCAQGIMLNLPYSCKPEVFLDSVQKLKARGDGFNQICPGHHTFPIDKAYFDKFIKCAEGIVDGSISSKHHKAGAEHYQSMEYEDIRITLPE